MSTLSEQFAASSKAQLEAQLHFIHTMASNAVGTAGKLIVLNLHTARHALDTSTAALQQLMTPDQAPVKAQPPALPAPPKLKSVPKPAPKAKAAPKPFPAVERTRAKAAPVQQLDLEPPTE